MKIKMNLHFQLHYLRIISIQKNKFLSEINDNLFLTNLSSKKI